jgi:hypothetical protein
MRGAVVLADVRLDLHDPAGDRSVGGVVGDEPAAEQRSGGGERGLREDRPVERRRLRGGQTRG